MATPLPFRLLLACAALAFAPQLAASDPPRPNILLILADDWGAGDAGAYGNPWIQTPSFDKLARQGLRFDQAYTPNAKCAPSRACILTGRNPWQLKEAGNHGGFFPLDFKTYPEVLAENGYFVGMTGKGWAPGTATNAAGKPRQLTGREFQQRTATPPTREIDRNDYSANFIDFLDAAPAGGPWCFWMGIREPHRDFEAGSGSAKGGKNPANIPRIPGYWPDNPAVRSDLLDYALEVEHLDHHIGRVMQELEKRGQLDNTLILVTSDNGRAFPREKGNLYRAANLLPFAVMWKNRIQQPGRAISGMVSFIDIAPTFLEAAGLSWEETGMLPSPGKSLMPLFQSPAAATASQPGRNFVVLGQERHDVGRPGDAGYPVRAIIMDGWLYARNFAPDRWPAGNPETGYLNTDGGPTKTEILNANRAAPGNPHWRLCFGKRPAEELYHLSADPDCLQNLAADPAQRERKASMEAFLVSRLEEQDDPRMFGRSDVFDQYPYAGPERGMYERFIRGERIKTGWVRPEDYEPGPLHDDGSPK